MRRSGKAQIVGFISLVTCILSAGLLSAAPVDGTEAKTAAQAWIDGGYSMQRLSAKTVDSVETVQSSGASVHVAKLSGGGAVILPTDDRIDPVIAFSPSAAELTPDEKSPLWALLSRDLAARMASATNAPTRRATTASAGSTTQSASQRKWAKLLGKSGGLRLRASSSGLDTVSDIRVAPLVKSRWSQRKNSMYSNRGDICFNYYTPGNYPCGCVATAMAQLMRFHEYPASVTAVSKTCRYDGTNVTYAMKGGAYAYANMPLVPEAAKSVSWYAGGATEEQRMAIGKLTYDCGVAMQVSWGSGGSSAGGAAAHGPLKDVFAYANARTTIYTNGLAQSSYRDRIIRTNLDAGYPVMLGIDSRSGGHGHEILADGYGYSDATAYTHLNMGWADEDDLWYALPEIGTTYNVVDGIVYNIFPTESGEIVSGRVVDASGNPIEGASVSIKVQGAASALKTKTTTDAGIFGFVVPAAQNYVVTATFGAGAVSVSATTGTSQDSKVSLKVGAYSYFDSSLTTEAACGNVSCGDITLSSVAQVEAPVITPDGGLFYPTTNVTITCATAGATIRYTLDGSDPTSSSTVYSAPFTVSDDTTVKARAFKDGFNPSIVVSATFTYDVAAGGPKGDFYSRPIEITGMSGSYVIEDNSAYTVEEGEAKHSLSGGSYSTQYRTCWFVWTAPGSGTMTFTTKFVVSPYLMPNAVAIYPDSASLPTDISTRIAMSKDFKSHDDYASVVSFDVTQGTTYRIVGMPLSYDQGGKFTLTWSGDLTVASEETKTTEVPVPHSWLAKYYPSAAASSYETLASGAGANGLSVWESYLAGLDPTNANSKLLVTIRMDGSTPIVECNVTNDAATALGYEYNVYGKQVLDGNPWTEPKNNAHRFFKVILEKP